MDNISWLFFDIGETLVDEQKSYFHHSILCSQELEKINIVISPEMYFKTIEDNYKKNEKRPLHVTWHSFNPEIKRPKWQHKDESLYPNTKEILDYLSQKYHLGIIANQGEGLQERLTFLGIIDYFSLIVSSTEIKIKKPNPEIFQLALSKANINASEAIYIGDRVDNDMIPAKLLGMKTIRVKQGFARHQSECLFYPSDLTVNNLSELSERL